MKKINMSNGLQTMSLSNGFSAVELLVTLFVASAFLVVGYQLYSLIINDGGDSRSKSVASNISYGYLQNYKTATTTPCTVQTPLTDSPITVDGLADVLVTVTISCPYTKNTSISKINVILKYNNPQQTISNATFYKP